MPGSGRRNNEGYVRFLPDQDIIGIISDGGKPGLHSGGGRMSYEFRRLAASRFLTSRRNRATSGFGTPAAGRTKVYFTFQCDLIFFSFRFIC